jgi:hypothetical protein
VACGGAALAEGDGELRAQLVVLLTQAAELGVDDLEPSAQQGV